MNRRQTGASNTDLGEALARVLHVPLTEGEWRSFKILSMDDRRTLGELTADALRAAYPLTPKEQSK